MKKTVSSSYQKYLSLTMLILAVGLLVLTLWRINTWGHFTGNAEASLTTALEQSELSETRIEELFRLRKERAEKLAGMHMFAPPPPEPQPPSQVQGILGDAALINGRWLKVGESIDGAKIIRIEATKVVIEWKGREITLAPIDSASAAGPSENAAPPESHPSPPRHTPKKAKSQEATATPTASAADEDADSLAWLGVPLSDKVRAALLKYWNQLSEEEKQKAKEEWNKMPEEQKKMAIQSFEHMPDR
ncbi:MAG: hypothetical protein JW709_01695 [Sedimentisphaerales bacterium]|nr:hypothetical protein [Sedimentisphaerales bacterium]